MSRVIGTRHRAVPAADARVVLDPDDAVRALTGCARRTHGHARRLLTVHALHRQEEPPHVGVLTHLDVGDESPHRPRWQAMLLLARDRARLTADTAAQVDHHAPAHQSPLPNIWPRRKPSG